MRRRKPRTVRFSDTALDISLQAKGRFFRASEAVSLWCSNDKGKRFLAGQERATTESWRSVETAKELASERLGIIKGCWQQKSARAKWEVRKLLASSSPRSRSSSFMCINYSRLSLYLRCNQNRMGGPILISKNSPTSLSKKSFIGDGFRCTNDPMINKTRRDD